MWIVVTRQDSCDYLYSFDSGCDVLDVGLIVMIMEGLFVISCGLL